MNIGHLNNIENINKRNIQLTHNNSNISNGNQSLEINNTSTISEMRN
jgi:hypothetical protein